MIKVLHLIWRIEGGGIENFCLNLLKNSPKEYQYDFGVCGGYCASENNELLKNSKIFHLPLIINKEGKNDYLKELKKILKENKYDIIHSHLAFMNISTLRIAKKCGIKIRISHTHVAGFEKSNYLINLLKKSLMKRYATKCFACSKETADFYYGLESKKVSILYSEIEIERFNKITKKDENKFIIVGRMCQEKNIEFIIKLIEKLSTKNKKFKFLWCGTGEKFKEIKRYVEAKKLPLIFLGEVNNVEEYLRDASYMLMPSLKEGFGTVAIEAQVSKVFVFASDRVPQDTDLGYINYYELENEEIWANKIINFIDKNEINKYSLNQEILYKYDFNYIAKEILKSYSNRN